MPRFIVLGQLIEGGAGRKLRIDLVRDAEGLGLFAGQLHAKAAAEFGELTLIGKAEFTGRHLLVSNRNDRVRSRVEEGCGNAPDPEGYDQQEQ